MGAFSYALQGRKVPLPRKSHFNSFPFDSELLLGKVSPNHLEERDKEIDFIDDFISFPETVENGKEIAQKSIKPTVNSFPLTLFSARERDRCPPWRG
jgi:hypothetical protein